MRVTRYLALALSCSLLVTLDAAAQQRRPQRPQQNYQQQQRQQADVARRPSGQPGEKVKEEILTTIFSQVVIDGLNHPAGVAVQPKSGDVYIADSGAGRIVRLHDVPGEYALQPVITGFPVENSGPGGKRPIGPLGLCFLNKYALVVGEGGQPDGKDVISIYRPPHAGAIESSETLDQLGPIGSSANSPAGEGNFFGVAATDNALFVLLNGEGSNGWIAKANLTDGMPGDLTLLSNTLADTKVGRPLAIGIGRQGQLILGHAGDYNTPNDSIMTVYDPNNGKLLMNVSTQLHDIVGLALSPQTGRIYALDYSWIAPEEGGLYRLDLGKDGNEMICRPTLLMNLNRPTGLAFAEDGTLFITTSGSTSAEHQGGVLVRIYNDSKL